MAGTFLGAGWDFLKLVAADGGAAVLAAEDVSVRQSVWIILGTAPGERVMRPEFGCGIHDLVFSPGDSTTIGLVSRAVRDALVQWEPRIHVNDVEVTSDPETIGRLLISVDYRVRTTNNQFNLVYPFYLERSAS
jgi:uncharacterized protein